VISTARNPQAGPAAGRMACAANRNNGFERAKGLVYASQKRLKALKGKKKGFFRVKNYESFRLEE
jgi:hypothetical protein